MDAELRDIYYNPKNKGAFGGVQRLWRAVKGRYSYKDVKNWLDKQESYALHKPARKKFTRQRVLVAAPDEQWQADLVDMQEFSKTNNGIKFLLTVIDVFSKYAWVVLLRDKSGPVVRDAFEAIFKLGRVPKKLQTDNGKEFYNRYVDQLLKRYNITLFSTYNNETKASVVERFNRTLKTDMWHYFTAKNTRKYIDIVQDLVAAYNNRYHRSIKMSPANVTAAKTEDIKKNLYGPLKIKPKPVKLNVGDTVLISKSKRLFEKGYLPNWTYEQFTIFEILNTKPKRYRLKDYNGEVLDGTFYAPELQKTKKRDTFQIEKILRRRKNQVFVKWWAYMY